MYWTKYHSDTDWTKCLFVDECCVSTEREGICLVKRPVNTRYHPEYVHKKSHCTRKTVSVFGLISGRGVGSLVRLNQRSNGLVYGDILDSICAPYIKNRLI